MKTEYLTQSNIEKAARLLREGGLVGIPTETVYGLGANAQNIGRLMARRNVYFVPFGQDDAAGKPDSLVAEFERIDETVEFALRGEQIQPVLT